MSVVNTMLRELAARQASNEMAPNEAAPYASILLATNATPAPRRQWPMLFLLLVVLAVSIVWWRWQQSASNALHAEAIEFPERPAHPKLASEESASRDHSVRSIASDDESQMSRRNATDTTIVTARAVTMPLTETTPVKPAKPATIGWELVDNTEPVITETELDSLYGEPLSEPTAAPQRIASTDARPSAAKPVSPAVFERQPSQLSVAERLQYARNEASRALAQDDRNTATRAIAIGLQLDGNDSELLLLQLQLLARQAPEAARQRATSLLAQQPKQAQIRQWLGGQLLQQRRHDDALTVLREHAPELLQAPDYHAVLALAEQQTGAHQAASGRYQQLLTLQPDYGQHWAGLALSQDALQNGDVARQAWQHALRDPNLPDALLQYGQQRLHQLGAAIPAQDGQ